MGSTWLGKVREFLHRDLWITRPAHRGLRALYQLLRTGVLVVEGAMRSEIFLLSAALTYQVTFALVPLLVVMLAVFKGVGGLGKLSDEVKTFLLRHITPDTSGEIIQKIDEFIGNINTAAIGVIGFLALLYTTLSLLDNIEKAFNRIWGVRSSRALMRRFTVYWAMLTVSPLLIAASLAMTTFVQNQALYRWLNDHVPFFGSATLTLTPFIIAWVLFTGIYVVMPNTRVDFRAALAGAVVSGTVWTLTKNVYVWYNTAVVSTNKFYGALGAIPVLLLWIYVSWVILLFGAEVAFAIQHVGTYKREIGGVKVSPADRERLALVICVRAVRPFEIGAAPPSAEAIAAELDAPVRLVHEVTHELVEKGILREVAVEERKDPGLVPARDPSVLTARDIVRAVRTHGDPCTLPDGREAEAIYRLVDRAHEEADTALGVTIKELVRVGALPDPIKQEGTPSTDEHPSGDPGGVVGAGDRPRSAGSPDPAPQA